MVDQRAKRRYVDTKTRYQGVFARHRLDCALGIGKTRCTCTPSYYGSVWDREIGRHRKTERRPNIAEARNLRADLQAQVRDGVVVERPPSLRFEDAHEQFIAAAHNGIALNKQRKPYRPKAILNLDSSLKKLPASTRRKDLNAVTRGELQRAVDDFRREGLSSSRIGSIINAVRSLYRWAEDRDLANGNPSAHIRLPANDDLGFKPIGLQDSRHTAATWLDHAGVSPKVASKYMGHKAPKLQPGAAPITLRRYTHILDGELERARELLDAFLAEREHEECTTFACL